MRAAHIYYLYDAIADFGPAMTVTAYSPFLLSLGLTLGEISLLNAFFWLVAVLSELPTGMLADGKSRAWSLKMGCVFLAFGGCAYLFAQGFLSALIAECLVGVGMAFFSGAEQAWVTDALHREGRDHERRQVFATASVIRGFVMVIGGFLGSLIALSYVRLIWLPLVFTAPLAWLVVHKLMNGQGEPIHKLTEMEALRASISLLKTSRALAWVIVMMIVFGAVVSFNHFWSPYFQPLVGTMGLSWVWALIYIGFALSAVLVRRLSIPQGQEAAWIAASVVMTGVGLVSAGMSSGLMLPLSAVILHEFGRGMFYPLVDSFVQHRVESGYRATFGSLQSLLGRIGLVITPVLIWLTIHEKPNTPSTIGFVWFVCGIVLLIGALTLFLVRPRK
jgi:MFS family permease